MSAFTSMSGVSEMSVVHEGLEVCRILLVVAAVFSIALIIRQLVVVVVSVQTTRANAAALQREPIPVDRGRVQRVTGVLQRALQHHIWAPACITLTNQIYHLPNDRVAVLEIKVLIVVIVPVMSIITLVRVV
jgi:hypothetical protein